MMRRNERILPAVPVRLIGVLALPVLFVFCGLWAERVNHSECTVGNYGVFTGDPAGVPNGAESVSSVCSLASLQSSSKAPRLPAVPITGTGSIAVPTVVAQSLPPTDPPQTAVLDNRSLFALGAIEILGCQTYRIH